MRRSSAVLVGWVLLLVLGLRIGHGVGTGALAVPGSEIAAWRAWMEATDPLVLTMALLRAGVLGVGWYLLVTTLLGVFARGLRAVSLVRFADAITAPAVRRVVQRGMGVVIASAFATSVAVPAVHAADPRPAVALEDEVGVVTMWGVPLRPEQAEPSGTGSLALPWQWLQDEATPRHDPAPAATTTDGTPVRDAAAPSSSAIAGLEGQPTAGPGGPLAVAQQEVDPAARGLVAHTVRPGESLWRIAARQLEQVWGRAPSDVEIVPYWREVIERNQGRLVVPEDPDLILPGQELLLPAVPQP